ncbi:hypothetical protein CUA39_000680, partial [Salmonella enterica subsp. enterica serovar Adelaide]|nr:hypothetical protein [Salmonella enterica subsp. enterica serovar Adelaide]EIX7134992.1 glucosyltransferase domain-containing protein [Salmonella enterica subsp. enterica serovar Adelaide]
MNNIKLSHFILVSVFLSIPVVLLNTYYADDLYRSALATYGWESDGRLFSLALYYIISVGGSLSDLYPFSQMTAYALLGITAYIVSSRIIEDKSIIGLIITLPIITSPLLLGNLLYRFDALTMMSGVLCATAPFAFRVASKRVLFIYSPILLLSSLSFYQASSIAFVSLSAMEFFKSTMKDESLSKSFLRLSYRASALFGGFIGFKVINSIFVVKNDYTEQLSKLVSLDKNAPEKIIDTFIKSMDLIYMFSKGGIGKIIFIFLIAVTISCLIIIFRKATHSAMGSLTRTLVGVIVSLIISFLCIPGFILLANTPVFYPRLYIGFGFFFVFGGYVVHYA